MDTTTVPSDSSAPVSTEVAAPVTPPVVDQPPAVAPLEAFGITFARDANGRVANAKDAKNLGLVLAKVDFRALQTAAKVLAGAGLILDLSKPGNLLEVIATAQKTGGAFTFNVEGQAITLRNLVENLPGRGKCFAGILATKA